MATDKLNWLTHWKVEKYHEDIDALVEARMPFWAKGPIRNLPRVRARSAELRQQVQAELTPYEVVEGEGNILLNVGIGQLLLLLATVGGRQYNNANAFCGAGDSNAAVDPTQTDLQGGAAVFVAMVAAFPSIAAQTVTWQSSFGAGVGTMTWEEVGVCNGNAPPAAASEMLNRIVAPFGTKGAADVWVLTIAVTIS